MQNQLHAISKQACSVLSELEEAGNISDEAGIIYEKLTALVATIEDFYPQSVCGCCTS